MSGALFTGIEAVLFDLDGTLLDSAPDLAAAAERMRARRGLPPLGLLAYRSLASSGARGMLRMAFGLGPDDEGFEALRLEFFSEYESSMTEHSRVFDEVEELLTALLDAGLRWGVVTNKSERFTRPLTRSMAIFETAETVISGDTTPHAKPHPAPLFEAARQMRLPTNSCIYVGDDLRDILAGRSAGMGTVAALYGYLGTGPHVSTWGADAQIDSPLQVLKMIELP